MAAHAGDSPKEATVELTPAKRRLPLAVVVFNEATSIPGSPLLMTNITAGEARSMAGHTFTCPQPFFDPVTRSIWIDGREYPLERVHYWERTKMVKNPAPAVLTSYTIGKQPAK